MNSLIASATDALREANQDSHCTVQNEMHPFVAIAVADGLGSHSHSEKASAFVTNFLRSRLEAVSKGDTIEMELIFQETKDQLVEFARSQPDLNIDDYSKQGISTTLICLIETDTDFHIAYCGNGCIWQIRAGFNQFSGSRYLPWNSVNLLNPHCVEEGGKPALYRYLSIQDISPIPTVIKIPKATGQEADWFMIGTDGIYTTDELVVGRDAEGTTWIRSEQTMELFYSMMSEFFLKSNEELFNEDLGKVLKEYLIRLKQHGLMHDDTSIAVVVPEAVLKFQRTILENKQRLNEAVKSD
jgi:PPM family protein phosphatase